MRVIMSKQISVKLQLVLCFLPLVSIWAYYRIGNLRNGILLNLALIIGYTGSILLGSIITYTIDPNFENTSMMAIFEMSIFFGFVIFMFWIINVHSVRKCSFYL